MALHIFHTGTTFCVGTLAVLKLPVGSMVSGSERMQSDHGKTTL